jgi:CRP-like cAMP-binding protein
MRPKLPKPETSATRALEETINRHPFVAGLKPEHLRVLADNAMVMHYEPGEIIFREGDPANRFYLICQGRVVLESQPRDSEPVGIQDIGPGDVLGWSWLFPPYYWHFNARAAEPTTAIFFYGTRLRQQCEEDPELGYQLMKRTASVVIQRLQSARKRLLSAKPG